MERLIFKPIDLLLTKPILRYVAKLSKEEVEVLMQELETGDSDRLTEIREALQDSYLQDKDNLST